MRKNGQLGTARRVAMKMGWRLSGRWRIGSRINLDMLRSSRLAGGAVSSQRKPC